MTKFDENWVAAEESKRQWMAENGLYREEYEHASCGVGLVVSIDGKPSRKVVENGIAALKAVWHRGAVDGTAKQVMARVSTFRSLFRFSMIRCVAQVTNHARVN